MNVSVTYGSIAFTVCAFFFLLLIIILYINRSRLKTKTNPVYIFLLVLTTIILFTEVGYVLSIGVYGKGGFTYITEILCRFYLFATNVWMLTFIYYVLCLRINNIESVKKREGIKRTMFIVILISLTVIYYFSSKFEIEYIISNTGFYSFGGNTVIFNYVIGIILIVLTYIVTLLKRLNFSREHKRPIQFTLIFYVVTTAIELMTNYDFNILTFQFVFMIATLYFTIESQDNKLIAELEDSRDKAEIADKAKTEFLANMSHEIRTPMNTILGFSESLINEKELTEEIAKRDTKSIYDAGMTLLDLINNILDISKIQSGNEEKEEKEYELKKLIYDVNSIISALINKDNIEFSIEVDNNIPNKYYGDANKIAKILINILKNAIKYTGFGKIFLTVSAKPINNDRMTFEIVVANTGHAMKQEDFDIQFNDFIKINNVGKNTIDSTSLGIIIAKRFAEMIDAKISFLNEPGKGTRYTISYDQKVIDKEPIGNIYEYIRNEMLENAALNLTGKKILVVDDNMINIKLISSLLQNYNINVEYALNGSECIKKTKETKYDLILLDHMMPEMDGISTMKLLRALDIALPPVVALTANSYTGIDQKYLEEGFDGYLSKPIKHIIT